MATRREIEWDDDDEPRTAPPVVFWYRVYCAALILFAVLIFGVALLLLTLPTDPRKPGDEAVRAIVVGLYAFGGVLCLAMGIIPFLLPRRPWAWVFHLVVICLGLTGGCTMIPAIFLLVFWIRPEVKRYFGNR